MLIHTWGIRRVISKNFESYITILGVFPKEHLIHSTGETKWRLKKVTRKVQHNKIIPPVNPRTQSLRNLVTRVKNKLGLVPIHWHQLAGIVACPTCSLVRAMLRVTRSFACLLNKRR